MSFTHQNVLDYKKRFEGCEYVELSCEEFDVLLTAAERSIRRPIADAPRDGTKILALGKFGWVQTSFKNGEWEHPGLCFVSWLPIPGEGGV